MSQQREGYLLIDHRFSPGLPPTLAENLGLDPRLVGEGKVLEAATLSCAHCKTVFLKNPLRARERERCSKCGYKYICDTCSVNMLHPDYSHTPFEKKLDMVKDAEAKQAPTFGSPALLLTSSGQPPLKDNNNG